MDDLVSRSCLALMTIVNKSDLMTLPDGTYELKKDAPYDYSFIICRG